MTHGVALGKIPSNIHFTQLNNDLQGHLSNKNLLACDNNDDESASNSLGIPHKWETHSATKCPAPAVAFTAVAHLRAPQAN